MSSHNRPEVFWVNLNITTYQKFTQKRNFRVSSLNKVRDGPSFNQKTHSTEYLFVMHWQDAGSHHQDRTGFSRAAGPVL